MKPKIVTYPEYMKKLGINIRRIRLSKGLTQQDLAKKIGYRDTMISYVERGNVPLLENLYSICIALDINIHEVLPSNKKPKYRIPLNK